MHATPPNGKFNPFIEVIYCDINPLDAGQCVLEPAKAIT
jgi:hypothetical protein